MIPSLTWPTIAVKHPHVGRRLLTSWSMGCYAQLVVCLAGLPANSHCSKPSFVGMFGQYLQCICPAMHGWLSMWQPKHSLSGNMSMRLYVSACDMFVYMFCTMYDASNKSLDSRDVTHFRYWLAPGTQLFGNVNTASSVPLLSVHRMSPLPTQYGTLGLDQKQSSFFTDMLAE